MNPELETDRLIAGHLPRLDPQRQGVFLEVGCGTFAYSFLLARQLGFKTLAVEPFPTPALLQACALHGGTTLCQGVLSEVDGERAIYLRADGDANFPSLLPDWNEGPTLKNVRSWTLDTLLRDHGVSTLSGLKLDVEGAEVLIMRQLPPKWCPRVVVFEYGGMADKREGKGGWTPERYANTLECLDILIKLGYRTFTRLDWKAGEFNFTDQTETLQIFTPTCHYGNIVATL